MSNSIGTLRESSFHSALKHWYKEPGDRIEERIDNYIIDIVRGNLLIEIQTANFSSIRKKLEKLTESYEVRLVYPIVRDKLIIKTDVGGNKVISTRNSPLHGTYYDIFNELIRIPHLVPKWNFSIEIMLIQIEEIRKNNNIGNRNRKHWGIYDRKLMNVLERKLFYTPIDFLMLKPTSLKTPFTNVELAHSLEKSVRLARKMSYCLRKMGILKVIGKQGNAFLHSF
ncbi:MAG: hypothetical protein ACW972_12205 [Promethearchaeota archaeon]|jgi:hypothetical protein